MAGPPEVLGEILLTEHQPVTTVRLPLTTQATLVLQADSLLTREDMRARLLLAQEGLARQIEALS